MPHSAAPSVVTGGCGFVGRHVVRVLAARGPVLVIDSAASIDFPTPAGVTLAAVDIRDRESLDRLLPPAVGPVVHLAALHYIPYCEAHPDETMAVNVGGTEALLDVLRSRNHRSVVLASTAAVYGFSSRPFTESAPPAPVGIYGESKVRAEELLREHCRGIRGVRAAAARIFNIYGPGDPHPHVIPVMLARAAQELPLELGNLWPRRDYVHVDDVARAILALVELLDPSASPATMVPFLPGACFSVNVCTGVGTSVSRLSELVGRASGRRLSIVEVESRRRRDDGHLVGSSALLTSLTGWKPRRELIDGVDDLVRRGLSPREHVHDIRLQAF